MKAARALAIMLAGLAVFVLGLVTLVPAEAGVPRPVATTSAGAGPSASPGATEEAVPDDTPTDDSPDVAPDNSGFWYALAAAGAVSLIAGAVVALRR
ncbi:MAG: hypothetical protein HZY73_03305 [Micropruina sp.]|nr:MAG: hypothetical protein HZY73_03305 [Micropruina sp.]